MVVKISEQVNEREREQNQIACQTHIIHRIRLHLTYAATAVFLQIYENVEGKLKREKERERKRKLLST